MVDRKDSDNTVFDKNVPPNPGEDNEDIDDDDELELDIEDIDLEDWEDER